MRERCYDLPIGLCPKEVSYVSHRKKSFCLIALVPFFLAILLCFSPLFAFWYGICFLAIFSSWFDEKNRWFVGFILIIAGALIVASRRYFAVSSDDMIRYYDLFESLYTSGLSSEYFYGTTYPEFVLPLYFWLLGLVFGKLSPVGVLFFSSFASLFFLWFWLEAYGLKEIVYKKRALCLGMTLAFFALLLTGQLVRQMISVPLVLLALSSSSKSKKTVYLMLAIFTHSTALPTFILFWGLLNRPRITVWLVFVCVIFIFWFLGPVLSLMASFVNIPFLDKFHYFNSISEGRNSYNTGYFLFLVAQATFISSIAFEILKKNHMGKWFVLTICYYFLAMIFSSYLHLFRIALPFSFVLLGYLFFHSTKRISKSIVFFLYLLAVFQIVRLGFLNDISGPMSLWDSYEFIGFTPFYYIEAFF